MNDQWKFTAQVKDVSIDGINHFLKIDSGIDIERYSGEVTVNFHLEPEVREWGIKDMGFMIDKVEMLVRWWVYSDDLTPSEIGSLVSAGGIEMRGGTIEGEFYVDSTKNSNGKQWEIDNCVKFGEDGQLMIESVTIELDQNVITISNE